MKVQHPMLSDSPPLKFGDLDVKIYDFDVIGDVLPMHTHDDYTVHITIVARGFIKAHGNGWETEAKAGQILDFKPGQEHEFIALEDNTRIINIVKNMAPKG